MQRNSPDAETDVLPPGTDRDVQWIALRRTIDPYVGILVILGGVSVFTAVVGVTKDPWGTAEMLSLLWALAAAWIYFGLRYRIYWNPDAILQKASGGADVVIKLSEIGSVALETSITPGRPFRRIAIYPKNGGKRHFIDVSLKHFAARNIRRLMTEIQSRRPDLELPEAWQ